MAKWCTANISKEDVFPLVEKKKQPQRHLRGNNVTENKVKIHKSELIAVASLLPVVQGFERIGFFGFVAGVYE